MNFKPLKFSVLLIAFLLLVSFSYAQSNYFKFSGGIGLGPNYSFTDVYKGKRGFTTYGTLDYHITPFVTAGLEAQFGSIRGGSITDDRYNRQFTNHYASISANAKIMLGEFVDYDKNDFLYNIRGLYGGLGIGVVNNNIVDIVRFRPSYSDDPGFGPFPGRDKSLNLLVPINLGINFFINDDYGYMRYVINVNAQSNVTFGEGLDGYNDPPSKYRNDAPDIFNTYTIGVKYFFGSIRSYRKTL
ncbi:hypothetical protein EZJ43_00265 [Pedobacter changchengzhani]|uniref:Outer membrane protein beta-barrel domain-containing protein n=1 Tax=Pedobacter changchengzhani TaxID=2529274 RepID=A0A4R5MP62_9SPHI|nr:hypothetical protein [Pedobacter changchengzhani]TDG37564.1 hypothetical protein EZJ43_00265 [Pedobacter changchengzhani]